VVSGSKIKIWRDNWVPRGNMKIFGKADHSRFFFLHKGRGLEGPRRGFIKDLVGAQLQRGTQKSKKLQTSPAKVHRRPQI
jgi:hypothetical protein